MSEPPPEQTPPDASRRKAPTIDLTATEIEGAPGADTAGGSSDESGEADVSSVSAEGSPSESRNDTAPRLRAIPWPAIGAGALAGAIVAGLVLTGLILSRDS